MTRRARARFRGVIAGLARAAALAMMGGLFVTPAAAQERAAVAIVATTAGEGVDPELRPSFDQALRARVEALDTVDVAGEAALDLAEVQLALGCDAASSACLTAVAEELGAPRLVIPRLERQGDELLLQVDVFDAAEGRRTAQAERRAPVASVGRLLDEVDGLARELLAPEEPEPTEITDPTGPTEPHPAPVAPAPDRGPDGGRVGAAATVAALGAIALGVGLGFGAWAQGTADRYADAPLGSEADAAAALGLLRDAQAQASAANVLFVAGGALLAAGVVWIAIELATGGGEEPSARLSPILGEGLAGLTLSGEVP